MQDGIIVAVGISSEIQRQAPRDAEIVDASGHAVLPGFVDAHAHPVFAGNRVDEFEMRAQGATYEEIAASGGGISSTVQKTRVASEDALLDQALRHANWFLRGGTTTVEAKSGYGLSLQDELKILRVIRRLNTETAIEFVPTFLGAHAIPTEFKSAPDLYVDLVVDEMLPQIVDEKLAEFGDVFCERGYFDAEVSRRILRACQERGLGIRIHADQLTNGGGAELAADLGAITADHLEQTEAFGITALARSNVQPVLLPGSVYSLGKTRYPRAREMIRSGLAVVLATDFNPGSSPTPSMAAVMSLAVTQMKMTPAEALVAATINAAYSLNRGDRIGSLEPGKLANFIITEGADYRELSYYFGVEQIRGTYVRGLRVMFRP